MANEATVKKKFFYDVVLHKTFNHKICIWSVVSHTTLQVSQNLRDFDRELVKINLENFEIRSVLH